MSRVEAERLAGEALEGGKWFNDGPLYSLMLRRVADLLEPMLVGREWRGMDSAPQDGTHILLHTTCHGVVEAWFAPGEWSGGYADVSREYSGAVWVCADDAFQIEVEELPAEQGGFHHGTATHWQPLPTPPTKENG